VKLDEKSLLGNPQKTNFKLYGPEPVW
jgi:hypothetical protein